MPSPTCTVNGGSTAGGVNLAAAAPITIQLVDLTASAWSITCTGTDDLNSAATVNGNLVVNYTTKTATLTGGAPAAGSALRFTSTVNAGADVNGTIVPAYTTTFTIYVLTAGTGRRVVAQNESTEGSSFGWVAQVNASIRAGAGTSSPTGAASGDLGGTYPAPTVAGITGTAGTAALHATSIVADTGLASVTIKQADNTANGATAATWTIQAPNATGLTATGGALALATGTGTTAAGAFTVSIGATSRLAIAASGAVTMSALGAGFVRASSAGLLSSSAIVSADLPSLAGDVTGAYAATVVSRINGTTVPATPAAGQFLAATSGTAATWRALVAGDIPAAASIMMAGDVTGTSAVSVVSKINGITAPAAAPGSANTFMVSSSTTALQYRGLVAGDIPAAASITMAGDVTGTSGANTAVGLTGTTGTVAMHGNAIAWDAASTAPTISQATLATTPQTFTIKAANVTTGVGSALFLTAGTGSTTGGEVRMTAGGGTTPGAVTFYSGATRVGKIDATSNYMYFQPDASTAGINFDATGVTGGGGQVFLSAGSSGNVYLTSPTITLRDGSATTQCSIAVAANTTFTFTGAGTFISGATNYLLFKSASGNVYLDAPTVNFRDGGDVQCVAWGLASAGAVTATVASTVTSFAIQQATTAGATGAPTSIQAQGAATTGGALNMSSGTGGTAAGNVNLQTGGTTRLAATPTTIQHNVPIAFGAIAPQFGTLTLSLGVNTTFTAAQYQAFNMFLIATAVGLVFTFPLVNGAVWLIRNNGNNAFTIQGAAGSGVSIPATTTKVVHCDGANFYST